MKRAGAAACALLSCALILLVLIAFAGRCPEPAYVFLYDSPDLDARGGLYTLTKVYVQSDNPEAPLESVVWFSSEKRFIYTIHEDWLFLCVEEEKGCCSILKLHVQTGGQPTYILQDYDLDGHRLFWANHLFSYADGYFYFLIEPETGSGLHRIARIHESGEEDIFILAKCIVNVTAVFTIDEQDLYCGYAMEGQRGIIHLCSYDLKSGALHLERIIHFEEILGEIPEDNTSYVQRQAYFADGKFVLQQNEDVAIYELEPSLSLSEPTYLGKIPIRPLGYFYPYTSGLIYRGADGYVHSIGSQDTQFWPEPDFIGMVANDTPVSFFGDLFTMRYYGWDETAIFIGDLSTGQWWEMAQ